MKTNQCIMRRGFTLVELLVVISIIATLAGVGVPALMAKLKDGDRTEAVMNAKQIGLALFSFESDNGSYPDDVTEEDITEDDTEAIISSASGSNKYFSQLFATGYIDQEGPFYCKSEITKKPDDDMSSASELLAPGDCGFAYVMKNATDGLSSSLPSSLPLAIATNTEGGDATQFDRNVYNKKAVVLRIDMSVITPQIKADGTLNLLETGTGTPWEDANINSPEVVKPAEL